MTPYAKQQKAWAARRERVARMKEKGLTNREIGDRMDPPITPQAVGKLLKKTR